MMPLNRQYLPPISALSIKQLAENEEDQKLAKMKDLIEGVVLTTRKKLTWSIDMEDVEQYLIKILMEEINLRGLEVSFQPSIYCPDYIGGGGGYTKPKVVLKLPEIALPESHDGKLNVQWDPQFRGSEIQKFVQEAFTQEYKSLHRQMLTVMQQHPTYYKYTFDSRPISPQVFSWLKSDFEIGGFRVVQESFTHCGMKSELRGLDSIWSIVNPHIQHYNSFRLRLQHED